MDAKEKLENDVRHYRRGVVILTAVKENLFEQLSKAGKLRVEEVSQNLNWTKRGTAIVLSALCAMEYLVKQDESYRIAPSFRDVFSQENFVLTKEWLLHHWRLMQRWVLLDKVLESGSPIRDNGAEKLAANHRNFILAMAHREQENLAAVVNAISLEGKRHLLDLGGGPGLFAVAFAEKYPQLSATVFDTPDSGPIAREFFEKSAAKAKLSFKSGNFIKDDLGNGYDAALLSSILHIYGPEENIAVLKKVNDSMPDGGKIILRDFFMSEAKTGPEDAALFAVNMLVNTETGNAYSASEMASWLRLAGFQDVRRIGENHGLDLLEGVK
jgi:hypothetical protein